MYVLTDFNRENGGTAFVPGSHKWCRNPAGREAIIGEGGNQNVEPVEAKAGSLVIWTGKTWHGSYNRTASGLRVSVPVYMVRPFIRTQENFIGRVPQEMLDRHPPRFPILMQQGVVPGYENPVDEAAKASYAEQFVAAYAEELGGGIQGKDLYS
jgi:ectoine hydroxylase-related dioxygenase (phytanoyl-CoA dioxygenase family)